MKTKKEELDQFINLIKDFEELPPKEQILCFGYFETERFERADFSTYYIKEDFPLADCGPAPSDVYALIRELIEEDMVVERYYDSYRLHRKGIKKVNQLLSLSSPSPLEKHSTNLLESQLSKIQNEDEKDFLKEALEVLKVRAFRASVLMVWIVCIEHLRNYVNDKIGLTKFQKANLNRFKQHKNYCEIKKRDDLLEIKDKDFLILCEDLGIFDKNLRSQLESHLGLRNKCAHPTRLSIKDHTVRAFIEEIIVNVFLKIG
jgi:hypothetical protein